MARLVTLSASFVVTMTLVAAALATVVSRGANAQAPSALAADAGVQTGGRPQLQHRVSADFGCVLVGR